MCLFIFPLALSLDLKVYILVEMDSVIAHVVMLWTKPDNEVRVASVALPAVSPSTIYVVKMQTSVIADVKVLTAEKTFG